MLRVAIIRCQQTEDMCPGTTDFKVAREGMAAFETTGAVEIVGFVSCGGCPGKRAAARAKMMVERAHRQSPSPRVSSRERRSGLRALMRKYWSRRCEGGSDRIFPSSTTRTET